MNNDLSGNTFLITGASRGIGAACARKIRQAGGDLVLHASGPSEKAMALASELSLTQDRFIFEDLAADGAGFRLVERAIQSAGKLDGVVNNAGIYLGSSLTEPIDEWRDGWRQTMAVNVYAPADICRAMTEHFRANNSGGTVVNIASRAGHRGDGVDHAAYAASKGAVLAMTKTWARGLASENIIFFAIAPGWVETRMAPQDIEARKKAVKEIPLGRVAAPEEVAEMVAFLLSGACASATGATFDINGASYVR